MMVIQVYPWKESFYEKADIALEMVVPSEQLVTADREKLQGSVMNIQTLATEEEFRWYVMGCSYEDREYCHGVVGDQGAAD
jgi:hypothetical protein